MKQIHERKHTTQFISHIPHHDFAFQLFLLMHQTGAAAIAAQEQGAGCMDVKPLASLPKATQWFSNTICMAI